MSVHPSPRLEFNKALLERVLTHLFDFVLEGWGPTHCRLKCEGLLCCNVLSALNPNTASRANTDHTCWCLNWDCKFGVNAGVSCKSIVNLQCLSSWHGSMEMVSTPGEMESTHWTVLGGMLPGWEGTQIPESWRVRWENLNERDYNMWEKWGCHNKLLSLGIWVSTSLEQMIQFTQEFLPSPLQTHKKLLSSAHTERLVFTTVTL